MKHSNRRLAYSVILFLAAFVSVSTLLYAAGEHTKNEQLTHDAWRFLGAKDYDSTIRTAEECVILFQDQAVSQQNELAQQKMAVPLGKVTREEKESIFQRGLLNDVATCWFILGKAQAAVGDKEKAEKAFTKAKKLTYARCWDPKKDEFWAPSDGAKLELKKLGGESLYD
jgi:tetratricopeptide (TPR) repeat protein